MTNPTPEQIEAAAKAIRGFYNPKAGWKYYAEEAEAALIAAGGVTPQEPPRTAAPTAKVILRGSNSDCASGVCPKGCSHLMWFCDQCSCEGGWGGTEDFLEALVVQHICPAPQVTPQEPGEPTYSTDTRQWSGSCPCIRAEQVDPECEWHGRPEFRRGGGLHSGAPSSDMVAKAARVLHIATCCQLSDASEHQEPQNEDLFTAGVVLNSVPLAAPSQVDEAKLAEIARRVDLHEWSRLGGSQGEQVADIVRAVLRGGGQ